jgi:hypothetical protein
VAASPPSVVASEQQLLVHPLDDLHQPPNDRPADRIARVRLSWGYTTPNRSALSLRSVAISRSNLLISAWLECGIVDGRDAWLPSPPYPSWPQQGTRLIDGLRPLLECAKALHGLILRVKLLNEAPRTVLSDRFYPISSVAWHDCIGSHERSMPRQLLPSTSERLRQVSG